MFCMNCGTKIPNGARFCSNCGYQVGTMERQELDQRTEFNEPLSHFEKLLRAAEQGNVMAQTNLADAYLQGRDCEKNEERAKYWYQRAAEQGDEDAIEIIKKFAEKQQRKLARPEVGKPFFFGEYCGKPIEWMVLTVSRNGMALLLSKYAVDEMEFNHNDENNFQWEDSTLRRWLNEVFYKVAFDNEERMKILTSENGDKFALLPPQMFHHGVIMEGDNEVTLPLDPTDLNCYVIDGRKCKWWSTNFDGSRLVVYTDGSVHLDLTWILDSDVKNSDKLGVRPCMTIKV